MKSKQMFCCFMAASILMLLVNCADDQTEGLFIEDVVSPQSPNCNAEPRSAYVKSWGLLDVLHPDPSITVSGVPSYYLNPRMWNNLIDDQRMPIYRISDEGMNYANDIYSINIIGYNVCVSQAQDDDPYRHCAGISDAISYFVPTSLGVQPSNPVVDWIPIVDGDVLTSYFGSVNNISSDGEWVVIRLQAVGQQQNGAKIVSNEFHFPLLVCRGCRACPSDTTADFTDSCFTYQDEMPDCVSEDDT